MKFYKENVNIKKNKFIVVGNKRDEFGHNRKEIRNLGKKFAEEINNSFFMTCSAKNEDNIDNLIDYIGTEAKRLIDKAENTTERRRKRGTKLHSCPS